MLPQTNLRKNLLEIMKPVALTVLEDFFKDLAIFHGFSLPVWKIFRISEPTNFIPGQHKVHALFRKVHSLL
jgi:hypothetical protein